MKLIRTTGGAWGCLSLTTLALTRKWRNELPGGQFIEGAEAAGEVVGTQAPLAVERAYKLDGVAVCLQ